MTVKAREFNRGQNRNIHINVINDPWNDWYWGAPRSNFYWDWNNGWNNWGWNNWGWNNWGWNNWGWNNWGWNNWGWNNWGWNNWVGTTDGIVDLFSETDTMEKETTTITVITETVVLFLETPTHQYIEDK